MKKYIIGMLVGMGIMIAYHCFTNDKATNSNEENIEFERIMDEMTGEQEKNDLFKTMDEDLFPYLKENMCGYMDEQRERGIFTLTKEIPENLYKKYFPLTEKKSVICELVDNEFIYITPNAYFPNGEMGEIKGIIQNDSIIQLQFKIVTIDYVMDGMIAELNKLSMEE